MEKEDLGLTFALVALVGFAMYFGFKFGRYWERAVLKPLIADSMEKTYNDGYADGRGSLFNRS